MSTRNSNPKDGTLSTGPVPGLATENVSSTHLVTVFVTHLIADILQGTGSASILDKELDLVPVTLELARGERRESDNRPLLPAEPGLFHLPSHPS